jgi:hypothetical protein
MNDIIVGYSNNKHEKDENPNASKENKIWTCKNCKEEVEDNFDFCWNCNYDKNGSLLTWQNQSLSLDKNLQSINPSEKNKNGWGIIQWGLAILIGIILIAYYEDNYSNVNSNYNPSSISSNSTSTNDILQDAKETQINKKISNRTFYSNENGLSTKIHFESGTDISGVMILTQMNCEFGYSYLIEGNRINSEFYKSACGRNSSNKTLYYDEQADNIYTYINGQKFTFSPN